MIDSHCHLDREPLFNDLTNILKRSEEVGIHKILTICTTLDSFVKIKEIVNKYKMIYGTFGIHPHETINNNVSLNQIVKEVKENKKIIGVGETGLDFYYNNSDKNSQIESFDKHIQASIDLSVPLIVHSRNAEKETFDILNNYKNKEAKILMHCFTGSKNFAKKLLDFNVFFSASGIITFKNSIVLQETFKSIPLNKLLIETDSPFLAPVPNRGKKNEPSFLKFTANKLSELKNTNSNEIIKNTTKNFEKLFNI